jgi:hypothetical protein
VICKCFQDRPSQYAAHLFLEVIVGMNSLGNTKAMTTGYVYAPPADGKPFRLNMGLRSLEASEWLEGGDDLVAQIPERIELDTKRLSQN